MSNETKMPKTPVEVVSFESDAFVFAMQVGNAAGSFKMPMESPSKFGVTVARNDGGAERWQFTDDPLNRWGLALRDHFEGDRLQFGSFVMRWFALQRMLELPRCQEFIRPEPGGSAQLIHSAVFDVAAKQPLNQKWEFDETEFFQEVARLYELDPD